MEYVEWAWVRCLKQVPTQHGRYGSSIDFAGDAGRAVNHDISECRHWQLERAKTKSGAN